MSSVKKSVRRSVKKSTIRSKRSGASPVHTRVTSSRSPQKGHKYTQGELNNYLNRVVDRHFEEAKGRVDSDLAGVSDCLYLNKFSQMANAELINPALVGNVGGTVTELDQTASPSKLRGRYNRTAGRSKSPSKKAGPDMTSILMDTETRRYVNEYKNQLEYLRNIIYALDLKLRDQDTWKREVNDLRDTNEKGRNAREELRKTLLETTQDLKNEGVKYNKTILELEGHNSNILAQLKAANNAVDDIETKLHAMEVKNAQLENENNELRAKINSGEIYKAQLQQARNDYLVAQKNHAQALTSLGDKIRNLENGLDSLAAQKKDLLNQNAKLNNDLAVMNQQLLEERANNADLTHELDCLKKKFQITQSGVELLQSLQDQRDAILKDLNKLRGENAKFMGQVADLERQIIERSRDIEAMERKNKDDLYNAHKRIRSLEDQLNNFKKDNVALKKDNIELKNHIITLEQLLCVKEDVYSQLQDANNNLAARTNDCDELRAQVDGSAKAIEGLDDKIYELEKCLIYLKNVVGEKEDYITNLKKLVLELKGRSRIYVPLNDDAIDLKLAEYINASDDPNKYTTLFIRERDGVYQFGTKRVYVKMEGGRVYVRVGGGFLHLDEFLRINTPIELEKMARNSPVNVLTRTLAVNKVTAGRNVKNSELTKIAPLTYKNALNITQTINASQK